NHLAPRARSIKHARAQIPLLRNTVAGTWTAPTGQPDHLIHHRSALPAAWAIIWTPAVPPLRRIRLARTVPRALSALRAAIRRGARPATARRGGRGARPSTPSLR